MKTSQPAARSVWLRLAQVSSLALALLLGAGCSVVSVPRPVGEKPHVLVAADWEGTWVMGKSIGKVKVVDAAAGRLQLVGLDDEDIKPRLVNHTVFITESGSTLFASLRNDEADAAAKPYVWARVRHEADQVLAWWPDVERFCELVRAGKLPGKVDGSNALLDHLTSAHLAALVSGELGPVFDSDSPAVFRRVAR